MFFLISALPFVHNASLCRSAGTNLPGEKFIFHSFLLVLPPPFHSMLKAETLSVKHPISNTTII